MSLILDHSVFQKSGVPTIGNRFSCIYSGTHVSSKIPKMRFATNSGVFFAFQQEMAL